MKSHHIDSKKHFLKILLSNDILQESVKKVLGRAPFYPLHLTLTTIHLENHPNPDLFDNLSKSIRNWNPLLPEVLQFDNDYQLEVMGRTNIKFLSLSFSCKNLDLVLLIENLCEYLTNDLGLEKRFVEINGGMECELFDSTTLTPLIHIPLGEKKTHISLLSTNDMKKNKLLSKLYSEDPSNLLKLIDTSLFTTTLFTLGSIALT